MIYPLSSNIFEHVALFSCPAANCRIWNQLQNTRQRWLEDAVYCLRTFCLMFILYSIFLALCSSFYTVVDTENCLLEMILPSKMCLVMANVSHLKSWSVFLRCTIYIPLVSNLTITVSPIRIGTIRWKTWVLIMNKWGMIWMSLYHEPKATSLYPLSSTNIFVLALQISMTGNSDCFKLVTPWSMQDH